MKVKKAIEWLSDLPEDYEMNFSQYVSIVVGGDSTADEYFIVLDDPIVGILHNDETKEVRFFTESSEKRVIKEIESGKKWREL